MLEWLPSSDEEGRRDSRRGVVLTDGAVLTKDAPQAPKRNMPRPVAACASTRQRRRYSRPIGLNSTPQTADNSSGGVRLSVQPPPPPL